MNNSGSTARSRSQMRIVTCLLAAALPTFGQTANWLTDGGGPRRTNWQTDEHIFTTENVKGLKILWKIKLDNKPREMHSLFPPLIVSKVQTSNGFKQIAIEAGISD